MSPKFNPPNLLIGQPRHQPATSRAELRAAIKRLREIDALHPEPTPDPGSPCKAHKEAGFVYSVIGCPRCYPEPTPESEERLPILARWPEADLFAALDAEGWLRGIDTAEATRAVRKVYKRLAAATPQADRGDGLREALAGCDYIELVGDPLVKAHVGAIRAALRDTASSGLDVETLRKALDGFLTERGVYRGITPERLAAEYSWVAARLRESADQERTVAPDASEGEPTDA